MKLRCRKVCMILIICMLMLMAGCSKTANPAGPHIDQDLITKFPYYYGFSDVEKWFTRNGNYVIERTSEPNNEVIATYTPNDAWQITAIRGYYGINGYKLDLWYQEDINEDDEQLIYNVVMEELSDICGAPVSVDENDYYTTAVYMYDDLEIEVQKSNTSSYITVSMCHPK